MSLVNFQTYARMTFFKVFIYFWLWLLWLLKPQHGFYAYDNWNFIALVLHSRQALCSESGCSRTLFVPLRSSRFSLTLVSGLASAILPVLKSCPWLIYVNHLFLLAWEASIHVLSCTRTFHHWLHYLRLWKWQCERC